MSPLVKGLLCLAFASVLFATAGVLIRLASAFVTTEYVVFFRNLVGLLLFVPLIAIKGISHFKTTHPWMHFCRALVGVSAMYAFFYGIAHFALSDAMMFVHAAPVLVPLLGHFLLKEVVGPRVYMIAVLGLIGIVLALEPSRNAGFWSMLGIGLFCTVTSALAFICVRKLSYTEPSERIVFYFTFLGTILTSFLVYGKPMDLPAMAWALLFAVGAVTTIAQGFLTRGYSYAFAGKIAPASYLTVVFAGFYGWLIWGETPGVLAIVGYVLVFMAAILLVYEKNRGVDDA